MIVLSNKLFLINFLSSANILNRSIQNAKASLTNDLSIYLYAASVHQGLNTYEIENLCYYSLSGLNIFDTRNDCKGLFHNCHYSLLAVFNHTTLTFFPHSFHKYN